MSSWCPVLAPANKKNRTSSVNNLIMHISPDGFVAGPNGEMNRIKVDEEVFSHVGKRI